MIRVIAIWLCLVSFSQAQSTFSYGMAPQQQQFQQQQFQRMPMQSMPMQGGTPMPMNRGMPMGVPMGGGGGVPIGPIIGIVGSLIQMAIAEDAKEKSMKRQNPYDINTSAGGGDSSYQPIQQSPTPVYRPVKPMPMSEPQERATPVKRISNNKSHAYSEYFDDNNNEEQQTQDAEQTNYLNNDYNKSQEEEDNTAGYSQRQETERNIYHKVGEQYTGQGVRTYYASGPFDKEVNGVPNGIVLPNGNIKSPFSDYTIDVMQNSDTSEGKVITDPNTNRKFRIPGFSN